MTRRRTLRQRSALRVVGWIVASLLFSQLAWAAYVCPAAAAADAMAERMAAGLPCDAMDPAQPALCHQHCAGSAVQSFELVKLPVAAAPAVAQVLEVPATLDAGPACARPVAATAQARPPPEPLFLATLRLRV